MTTTHTVAMLHCPFCGGDPDTSSEGPGEVVYCEDCGSESGAYRTFDEAIKAWNRRVDV